MEIIKNILGALNTFLWHTVIRSTVAHRSSCASIVSPAEVVILAVDPATGSLGAAAPPVALPFAAPSSIAV